MYYTYIIRCTDNSLYTGICTDLAKRMREHALHLPDCAKYTRARTVEGLEAAWESATRSDAAKLEYRLKSLTHPQKEALLRQPDSLFSHFSGAILSENYRLLCTKTEGHSFFPEEKLH